LGRYSGGDSKGGSGFGFYVMIVVVWLVMFLIVLPPVMGCSDVSCGTQDPNNLLVLWLDIFTLFGTVAYLQFVFGVWAGIVVIGALFIAAGD
jgi:hypothetical protein